MDANRLAVQSHKPIEEMSEQELLVLLVKDQRKIGALTEKVRGNTALICNLILLVLFLSFFGLILSSGR